MDNLLHQLSTIIGPGADTNDLITALRAANNHVPTAIEMYVLLLIRQFLTAEIFPANIIFHYSLRHDLL